MNPALPKDNELNIQGRVGQPSKRKGGVNKTFSPKKDEIKHSWYLVDAKGKVLGRLAAKVATILRGKHKSIYTPHLDCGDFVVVINAKEIKVTGKKMLDKVYLRFSGYPGGQKQTTLEMM